MMPRQWRAAFLTLVSAAYLWSLAPRSVVLLMGLGLAVCALAPLANRRGGWLPLMILAAALPLAYSKYLPPLLHGLRMSPATRTVALPLGISYFTFKLIHYAIERSRGNLRGASPADFFCYLYLFPIFTAGPIERFDHFLANRQDRWSMPLLTDGLTRLTHGLVKRFVFAAFISDVLLSGKTAAQFLRILPTVPPTTVLAFLCLSFLYMYLDFSAYSDLAIGASRLFGLGIQENFNWPILAPNIGSFWKRWHMTLTGWCQAYVYLPTVGLTRNPYFAVGFTMLCVGLWHAGTATAAAWGLYHGTGLIVYLSWARLKRRHSWTWIDNSAWLKPVGWAMTFVFASLGAAFPCLYASGTAYGAVRLICRVFAINLPT
jgi:alginate O-acetyltransferase complex protein AlgI